MPEKNDNHYKRYLQWRESDHGKEVYRRAKKIVKQMIDAGWTHYSAQMIVMTVRHKLNLATGADTDGWKVNNNYTSYLARELMLHPDIPGNFFETRNHGAPSKQAQTELL